MATMTTADVLQVNNSEELIGLINEVIEEVPEMQFFAASPVKKNSYYTLTCTGNPTVAFREPGTERVFETATLANRLVECKYLDASWALERSVAQKCDWGEDFAKGLQAKTHLAAAFKTIATQIWYGRELPGSDAGFDGFATIIDGVVDKNGARETVVSATDADVDDGSSVFFVRTGIDSAQLAWGSSGSFVEGEIIRAPFGGKNESGDLAGAYYWTQELAAWVGLQVTSRWAAARIEKLSATTPGAGLTDELMYRALERFPAGVRPDAIFMSRRSLSQLRQSRTAYNPIGAPVPYPTEFEGIKILTTDAISNAETYSATGADSGT